MIISLGIYAIIALIFFTVSMIAILPNKNLKLAILPLNIVFLVLVYTSFAFMLGRGKPVFDYPLFNDLNWNSDTEYMVVGGYQTSEQVNLLVLMDKVPRLYTFPPNDAFENALKRAMEQKLKESKGATAYGFKIKGKVMKKGLFNDSVEERFPTVIQPLPQERQYGDKEVKGGMDHYDFDKLKEDK